MFQMIHEQGKEKEVEKMNKNYKLQITNYKQITNHNVRNYKG